MQPLVPLVFHSLLSLYPPSLPIFGCAECTIKTMREDLHIHALALHPLIHANTKFGVGRLWWFNYPGLLLHIKGGLSVMEGL